MCKNAYLKKFAVMGLLLSIGCAAALGDIIYVDDDAIGLNNGSSWAHAYTYLQDALELAEAGDQIWVALGIYRPAGPDGNREETFTLKSGVAIYGGFAGGETSLDQRDWKINECILSGDLNGDDGPDFSNGDENSYHVVTGSYTENSAILDGFTVERGSACDGRRDELKGAGILIIEGSPTIVNCRVAGNRAADSGGGLYIENGHPQLENCVFVGNIGSYGGAIYAIWGDLLLVNCSFLENEATLGGGIHNESTISELVNCIFSGNKARYDGGAVHNCESFVSLINCTISTNSAGQAGGGIHNDEGSLTVSNCILWGNSYMTEYTDEIAQIYRPPGTMPIVEYSCIQSWTGTWGGVGNISSDPRFVDYDGDDDIVGTDDDDLHLWGDSHCIDAGDADVTDLPATDIEGKTRRTDGDGDGTATVDMGAYEFIRLPVHRTLYVDSAADSFSDGTGGWENACNDLHYALWAAEFLYPDVNEIRISGGVYTPPESDGPAATFYLVNGATIRGGYAGSDNLENPNEWDPEKYITILSGDHQGDDSGSIDPNNMMNDPKRLENSYHVVTAYSTDASARLESLTIMGGTASGSPIFDEDAGGGLYVLSGSCTVANCTFMGNVASGVGGAVYCMSGSPVFQGCTFENNSSPLGGAIHAYTSDINIEGCIIRNNAAIGNLADGGGIYCFNSIPRICNTIIVGNSAEDDGGGIFLEGCSAVDGLEVLIKNCTIVYNTASPQGGGIYVNESSPVIVNCIIWGNGDDLHSTPDMTDINITFSCIEDGFPGPGNISSWPHFADSEYHLLPWSPGIDSGDPNGLYSNHSLEPGENGRVNMGGYGNTAQAASKADDLDGDGRADGEDSDDDGLPDGWEILHFGDLSAGPDGNPDVDTMADGSALTNLDEYLGGHDPWLAYDGLKEEVFVDSASAAAYPREGTLQSPYSSIRQAIEAAREGATIRVATGLYEERIIIDEKTFYIRGGYNHAFSNVDGFTTLSGAESFRPLMYINVKAGLLTGFNVTNGYAFDGAGIYFFNSGLILDSEPTLKVYDCMITDNHASDDGGGISFYWNSHPLIERCTIANNTAADNAGGIFCRLSSPVLRDCNIWANTADSKGGGVFVRTNSRPWLEGCDIIDNVAGDDGGGIFSHKGAVPTLTMCLISSNEAMGGLSGGLLGKGGGIKFEGDADPGVPPMLLEYCSIADNKPDGMWLRQGRVWIGGGVALVSNDMTARDLVLEGYGEISIDSGTTAEMNNCTVTCDLAGVGSVQVPAGSKLILEGYAQISLDREQGGTIYCKGHFLARDYARIMNTDITIGEAETSYGKFFIEDSVSIINNYNKS